MLWFLNRTLMKTMGLALLTATVVVLCIMFFDLPISEAAATLKTTGWYQLATTISQAANYLFVLILVTTGLLVSAVDALRNGLRSRSQSILYICLTIAVAMLLGETLKEVFGRARPELFFTQGIYGFFPLAGDYLHFSFPSGHTIRAFSSMTALGLVIPRLRIPAITVASLIGLSRVVALKHYPSDVLVGAFIGITTAIWGWRILYPYGRK